MVEPHVYEGLDMIVVEGVVDHPPLTATTYHPGGTKEPHRLGHPGLGHPHGGGHVAHAQLTRCQPDGRP